MRTYAHAAVVAAFVVITGHALATEFALVSEGRPRAEIVLDKKEITAPVLFAAQELQRYVKAISGASLPVVQAATGQPAVIVTTDPQAALGWSVLEARWRPDRNEFAEKQVWEGWRWTEGWGEKEQFYPMHFVPAGSIHLVLRNGSSQPETIELTRIDGAPLQNLITTPKHAGPVIWHRLDCPQFPTTEATGGRSDRKVRTVPAGQWVECAVRFRDAPEKVVRLKFKLGSGKELGIPVEVKQPAARIEHIGFSKQIDTLYCYVRRFDGKAPGLEKIFLDGKPAVRACKWVNGPKGCGVALAEVRLQPKWELGSYHLVEVHLRDGTRLAQPVRAWDSYFSVALFGLPTKERVLAAKEKGFNTYYWYEPTEIIAAGLNHIPHSNFGKVRPRTLTQNGVLFNFNIDEPDCHDWTAGKELPFPKRLGVNAEEVVLPRIDLQRKDSPCVPGMVLIDNTFKPLNYYVYGQISDVVGSDPYQLLGLDQIDYVRHVMEVLWDASTPRPTLAVLWIVGFEFEETPVPPAGPKEPGDPKVRPTSPKEQRMMAFYALGAGAKGLGYFCDFPGGGGGDLGGASGRFVEPSENKPLWEELGRINRDTLALAPYLSIGCPLPGGFENEKVWVREIMCGPDNVVVIVVNKDHYIGYQTRWAYEWHNPAADVRFSLGLPEGFGKCEVREVKDGKLIPAQATLKHGKASFALDVVDTARAFVITKNS